VEWSTGEAAPSIIVRDSGLYWVSVRDGGCFATDTIRITTELCHCKWLIPDAFTPNNDGKNDLFRVVFQDGCLVSDFRLRIYDRWGKMVFVTTDPAKGWNGTKDGIPLELGVFMYELSFTAGTRGQYYQYKGDISLLR
jgi:gliding motility-associated-like protein